MMKVEVVKLRAGNEDRDFYIRPQSSDTAVVNQIFIDLPFNISKLGRFPDLKSFLKMARATGKRPLIIDGGANIGATSVYFSAQCHDALIIAIEPEASNFELLVENTKGMPVIPLPYALAASAQRVRVIDVGQGNWGFQTRPVGNLDVTEDAVNCVTINEIFAAHDADCFPFIVKIDIEGGERELFQQNTEWIEKTPLLIIELHDWLLPRQGVALPFLRCIGNLDRDFVHVGEHIFSIANKMDTLQAPRD